MAKTPSNSMEMAHSHVSEYRSPRSLCHISLQGFPPDPSFQDYQGFPEPVTCSVGAIIAMKQRYGQLKGESSD